MSDVTAEGVHPLATEHFPVFLTAPGQTDVLLVGMAVFLLLAVVGLGLLALFTHNHAFWIAGLLLALVPLPDFSTPLTSMAQSLGKMAGGREAAVPAVTQGSAPVPLDEETAPGGTAQVPLADDPYRPQRS